jgi:carbon-monoxide dehydrogenase small subunit
MKTTIYTYTLNGTPKTINCELSRRLLDVIRIDEDLIGTKEGCQEGECGACLVFVDDEIVNACLVPMANVIGKEVVTIEAFAKTETYSRIEKAFIETGAVQCGYCTPGMVMAVAALLKSGQPLDENTVRLGLSGNLCRCTGYQTIFEAVKTLGEGGADHGETL